MEALTEALKPYKPQRRLPVDAGAGDALPAYCRFKHLKEAGIVTDHGQLRRLVADQGFPPGFLLSPNVRVWNVAEVNRWLAAKQGQTTA